MTWEELATVQQTAALHLFRANNPAFQRAVCGRAYYAAYALIASRVPKGTVFEHGWRNPPHARLPAYINNIAGLREIERRDVVRALRRLRQRREDADYRPGATVDYDSARLSMRDVRQVFIILGKR